MRKQLMAISLASVMALSLAGCGGGNTTATTAAASGDSKTAETSAEAKQTALLQQSRSWSSNTQS